MPRLPADDKTAEPIARRLVKNTQKHAKRWARSTMKSRSLTMPRNIPELPIRLRPWFILFTSLIMIILALLGFTNLAREWPVNDKILHFVCFCSSTGVFYFIFDVDEDARRIWFWRYFGLIATGIICFFFGGIISEVVQSLLPYKTFQYGDIIANLCGSSLGLYIAYHLERHYRERREIARLYKPLTDDADEGGYTDDEDFSPRAVAPPNSMAPSTLPSDHMTKPNPQLGSSRISPGAPPLYKNVWDDTIEVFDIGDSDEEGGESAAQFAKL